MKHGARKKGRRWPAGKRKKDRSKGRPHGSCRSPSRKKRPRSWKSELDERGGKKDLRRKKKIYRTVEKKKEGHGSPPKKKKKKGRYGAGKIAPRAPKKGVERRAHPEGGGKVEGVPGVGRKSTSSEKKHLTARDKRT